METTRQVTDDLAYLGGLLRRSERGASPFIIYALWAVLTLVGFSMVDFAPQRVGLFWLIAGPLGGVASAILGHRYGLKIGQVNREEGLRIGWHWFGMMLGILLVVPLGVTGAIAWSVLSRVILLIVALAYFLAGVHMERPLKWVGVLMMAGYVGLFFIPAYGWTLVGILVSLSLIVSGLMERRGRGTPNR
jgi:hypothetical protein